MGTMIRREKGGGMGVVREGGKGGRKNRGRKEKERKRELEKEK